MGALIRASIGRVSTIGSRTGRVSGTVGNELVMSDSFSRFTDSSPGYIGPDLSVRRRRCPPAVSVAARGRRRRRLPAYPSGRWLLVFPLYQLLNSQLICMWGLSDIIRDQFGSIFVARCYFDDWYRGVRIVASYDAMRVSVFFSPNDGLCRDFGAFFCYGVCELSVYDAMIFTLICLWLFFLICLTFYWSGWIIKADGMLTFCSL